MNSSLTDAVSQPSRAFVNGATSVNVETLRKENAILPQANLANEAKVVELEQLTFAEKLNSK